MSLKTAITVLRSREELMAMWSNSASRPEYLEATEAAVHFADAPGDRGTEIHVDLDRGEPAGKLQEIIQKLTGSVVLAKVKDDLRRFKAVVETGEVPRSDGSPEGELAERKLKQRPAQPLADSELAELEKAGV
jgi:hypothetical protein